MDLGNSPCRPDPQNFSKLCEIEETDKTVYIRRLI